MERVYNIWIEISLDTFATPTKAENRMMKQFLPAILFLFFGYSSFSQANMAFVNDEKDYREAKEYFINGEYAVLYPLLKPLSDKYVNNQSINNGYIAQDIQYYDVVTELKLNMPESDIKAIEFVTSNSDNPRGQLASYHLANYYFGRKEFADAVTYYQKSGYDNLTLEQISEAKFNLAYSYLQTGKTDAALPLFKQISNDFSNPHFADANYYYGYTAFKAGNYDEASAAFNKISGNQEYEGKISYYMAQINYLRGDKDAALEGALNSLKNASVNKRSDLELLVGQIYFERKEFSKALPYIEEYVNTHSQVTKEVMYELAYCYYDAGRTTEAIEGFKQLSNEQDSLGQNSMFLLGDLYLQTGQKTNARNAFKFSADNSSNVYQQEVSRFNYAKLSYELGFNDVALSEIQEFTRRYPQSQYIGEAREILINLLANSNNYAEALNLYNSFGTPTVQLQRLYPGILLGRATELYNLGQLDQAKVLLDQIEASPYNLNVLPIAEFWQGELAYRRKDYGSSIDYLNRYLSNGTKSGEANPLNAHYTIGYAYLQSEEYAQAYSNFNQVASTISASSSAIQQDAYVRSADALFMQKEYSRAAKIYQQVADLKLPQSDYSLFQIALINGIDNQPAKIKALGRLVQQYPLSDLVPEAYMQIADAYMAEENFKEAIPYLNYILQIKTAGSYYPSVYLKLGLNYYNLNDNSNALKNYEALLEKYPQSSESDEALENIKSIYVEQGQPDKLMEIAKKAGKNVSTSEADSLVFASALIPYNNGNCKAAIDALGDYLTRFPSGSHSLEALYNRSECYRQLGDWQNAVKGYGSVADQGNSPYAEDASLFAARGYYLELKDYDSALIYFEKLLQLSSNQTSRLEALRGLVRSYYQTGDFTRAAKVSEELLNQKELSSDDKAIANLVLGKALQQSGDCNGAIDAFKKVIPLNQSAWSAEAMYNLGKCYFENGDVKLAEKTGMELIRKGGGDYWVTSGYILLGDIYLSEKDYFNAKATFKSVSDNATIEELRNEATEKYNKTVEEEKATSKIQSEN